jgi:GAF domain-containing protein
VQELYTTTARGIAPALALVLGGPPREEAPDDEDARLAAVARIGAIGGPADDELNQLVTLAKDLMGAAAAAIYIVEADRVWARAAAGLPLDERARSDALCGETLDHREGLVVSDLWEDPIYRDRSYVVGPPFVRFYVVYPVLSPDGYRVAAFSIFDTRPRTFRPAHAILLRQFARRAGAMLFDQP